VTQTELGHRLGTRHSSVRSPLYSVLIGLAALAVLLQGLWAGLFIHEGQDFQQSWVDVHARCGEAAILFAALASVVAFLKLRSRPAIVAGTVALTMLLVLEAYLGGLIGGQPDMTVVHLPLGMALMGLVIWLTTRAFWPARAVAPASPDTAQGIDA
jgi:heme A synthase